MSTVMRDDGIDHFAVSLWLLVLMFGLVMVGSASMEKATADSGNAFALVAKHGIFVFGAVIAALVSLLVPIARWYRAAPFLLFGLLVALLAVFVDGVGKQVNGASRWIDFRLFTLQTAELAKLGFLIYAARYLADHREELHLLPVLLRLLAMLGVLCVLLLLEPDFGTAVVVACTVFLMMFLAGARLSHLTALCVAGMAVLLFVAGSDGYRADRLATFQNPFAFYHTGGYQLAQALIAFGRGEWFGMGLGDSIQKQFYLPEAHNDFLFAVIGEETGMVGASLLVAALLMLSLRLIQVGRAAERKRQTFASQLAYGIGILIGVQSLVNVGVNVGLLPTKGLTLPYVSFGGNSLIISGVLMGIALRVHWETVYPPKRAGRG